MPRQLQRIIQSHRIAAASAMAAFAIVMSDCGAAIRPPKAKGLTSAVRAF